MFGKKEAFWLDVEIKLKVTFDCRKPLVLSFELLS